jgi:hypothetical protein
MMKHLSLLSASLLLVGCARTTPMVLGPDHPASPDAPVAPVPPPSTTLAVSAPLPTRPSEPTKPDAHGAHDMGHGDHGGHAGADGASTAPATTQAEATAVYTCPMHPEVVSNEPGRCPECKMKLVRKGAAR